MPPTTSLLCDFCGVPVSQPRVYACSTYFAGMARDPQDGNLKPGYSTGGWTACPACVALIDANDREGLTLHCLLAFKRHHPELAHVWAALSGRLHTVLSEIQQEFFKHRIHQSTEVPTEVSHDTNPIP